MDTDEQKDYKYFDWTKGIADSPELGFADMRNCNIERYPNLITTGNTTVRTNSTALSTTVTRVGATNVLNFAVQTSTQFYNGMAVTFSSTGTLPAPLVAGTVYYLSNVFPSPTNADASISVDLNGALSGTAITLTTNGTGVHSVASVDMSTVLYFQTFYPLALTNTNPTEFCIDDNGRVWYQNHTGSAINTITQNPWYYMARNNVADDPTSNHGSQGLSLFTGADGKNWLFSSSNLSVDVVRIDNLPTFTWVNNFQTLVSGGYHESFLSQTNVLYFCDGNQLDSIEEAVDPATGLILPFLPSDPSTYVAKFNDTPALKNFQSSEQIRCLENLGNNLMIGGGISNYIYQWDELAPNVNLIIRVGEKSVVKMKNISNVLYILAGVRGIVYYTTGYAVIPLKKIPEYLSGGNIKWGGIEKIDGNLLFGFVGVTGDNNGNINGGVGKIFLTEQAYQGSVIPSGTLTIDQTVASGSTSANVTALSTYQNTSVSIGLYETYYLGSSTGVDVVDPTVTRSDGSSYVVMRIEHVSPVSASTSFEEVGYEFEQSLASGQGVQVFYRSAMNTSFTSLVNFNFSNPDVGTQINGFANGNITDVNLLQLKVVLTSDGAQNPILQAISIK